VIAALLAFLLGASACGPSGPDGMRLVWADEFNGDGVPDPSRWTYEVGYMRNNEWQHYTYARRENARVEGGLLTITARREVFESANLTSASLLTRERFTFTYGRVIIRAKVPPGRGVWPALWMVGTRVDRVWPELGEIDIMEYVGYDPNTLHFTVHTGAYNYFKGTQQVSQHTIEAPWEDFHDYELRWTPERLEWYFDGLKVHEFVNDGSGEAGWPFDQPMYLRMNLAIGGSWGGREGVDDAIFPAEFQIDHVRIYQ
jgi:beta-glucanase (GH16 family)